MGYPSKKYVGFWATPKSVAWPKFSLAFLHIHIGITGGSSKITFSPSGMTDLYCSWHSPPLLPIYISWTQQILRGRAALQHGLCSNWHLLQSHHFFSIHYRHWLERMIKTSLEIKAHLGLGKKKSMQSSILNGCIYLIYLLLVFSYTSVILDSEGVAEALICFSSGLIGIKTPEDSKTLNSEVHWQTFVLIITRAGVSLYNLELIAQPTCSLPYWCSS